MSGVVRRSDSQKFITSDNAWLLDVIANANPVAASDYDSIIAYWQRTNRLLTRTVPDCSLQTVGAFSRAVVGPIVVDFTPVTRRRVRLLAQDRQHDDLRPPCGLSCASHSSRPTRPSHRAAESRRAHHAARHGHDLFAVRWAGAAESVRAVEQGGPARRGRLSPWTLARPLSAPFSPTPPLSPSPTGGPPLRSGFERRTPA